MPLTETILGASNAAAGDDFGVAVAVSRDGSTLVIGAVTANGTAGAVYVYTGPDFATETILTASDGAAGDDYGNAVAVSDDGSVIVVGAPLADGANTNLGKAYIYSGAGWSTETIKTPTVLANNTQFGNAVAVSGDGTVVAVGAVGQSSSQGRAYVYHGASWATLTSKIGSDSTSSSQFGSSVALSTDGSVLAVGSQNKTVGATANAGKAYVFNGVSWATETILHAATPIVSGGFGTSIDISGNGSVVVVGAVPSTSTPGKAYVLHGASYATENILTASDGQVDNQFGYSGDLVSADLVLVGSPGWGPAGNNDGTGAAYLYQPSNVPPPTPVFGGSRFYEAPPWRFIVTDLDTATLTLLDHLALNRSVTVTRAASRVLTLRVPSDNPEVNIPTPDPDEDPFVSEGTRLIYAFRREGRRFDGDVPWRIRASGLVLNVTDDADTDHATSTVNSYDPWQYLYRRPVLLADGSYPDEDGRSYPAGTRPDDIIIEQFTLAVANGTGIFTDFGQTPYYGGTIESCEPLPDGGDGLGVTFQRGTSLGEMLDTLAATGTCDPVFDPIYDPASRPGILCELSIYQQAGSFKPDAVFGWDRWPRSVVELSRQVSGNDRGNRLRFFAGQAGPPVPEEDDAVSIAKFGDYYASQNLVGTPSLAAAHLIAQRQLALRAQGLVTYTLSPAAERSPILFQEYREADTVPIYASKRFRKQIPGDRVRIESIPIVIGDDQLERVNRMLVSFVPETGS